MSGTNTREEKPGFLQSALNFLIILVIVLGCSWLLRTFVVSAYEVPSGSMETTIMTDDRIFSEKWTYWQSEPAAGDIVTFEDPQVPGRTLVKRLIATEGQTVDLIDGTVYIDGQPLAESYTHGLPSYPLESQAPGVTVTFPYTVPAGEMWVMGDNRTNSADSRYFGSVSVSAVTGKACCIYWPLNRIGGLS